MERSTRRHFLRMGGITAITGFAGCSGLPFSRSTPTPANKDTDGDGVIDSEDYAPRDASVQRAEQVEEVDSAPTETPAETETATETARDTETATATQTPSANLVFSDEFEDGRYDDVWEVVTHHDVESVTEEDSILTCTSPPDETAYAPDMTVISIETFQAQGIYEFTTRHRIEPEYWSSKIFRLLDMGSENKIQLEEKPHNGIGFNIRSPQNNERVLDSTTAETSWTDYSLKVDFDDNMIVSVERDSTVYEINQPIGSEFSQFRLGLAENNCVDHFESVSVSRI